MTATQKELPMFQGTAEPDPNIAFLISVLQGRDWTKAKQIIEIVKLRTGVEWLDRKVRELASLSKGQICGGQRGYKLVELMTAEEYQHWRNWMMSQADDMKSRVMESDKLFYGRKPVVS